MTSAGLQAASSRHIRSRLRHGHRGGRRRAVLGSPEKKVTLAAQIIHLMVIYGESLLSAKHGSWCPRQEKNWPVHVSTKMLLKVGVVHVCVHVPSVKCQAKLQSVAQKEIHV